MTSDRVTKIVLFCFISLFLSSASYAIQSSPSAPDSTQKIDQVLLDRITVVGNPVWMSKIPGAASYISAAQLQEQNYSDINRVLRSISGINIQEEDGYGLRPNIGFRGTGVERSSKINIMEDGVLAAPAPYSAPAAYYFPNVSRMSSVEVRKGSSQIKYGPNTTGGALNLISTPIPTEMTGNAEFSLGERKANKIYANFGNRSERFGYMLEVMQLSDNGFKNLDNGDDTGFIIRDMVGKFMFQSAADASVYQRIELKLGYNDQTSDETYLGLSRDDFENTPFRRYAASQADQINTEHYQFMARHIALLSDQVDVTTTLYHNDFARNWYKLNNLNTNVAGVTNGSMSAILRNPDTFSTEYDYLRGATDTPDDALIVRSNNREYYSQGVESILGLSLGNEDVTQQIEFGVRFHRDQEDRFQFQDGYRLTDGVMIQTSSGAPGSQANRIGSASALSFFVQDRIQFDRWTFTPGLRYENIWFNNKNYGGSDPERTGSNLSENDYTVNVFVPGLGITWQAIDNLNLIAGVHRGFSPPSPGSSSDTRSELSVNYELGFRYAGRVIQTEIIGFYNDYSNLLGSDLAAGGGGGTNAQFNAGEIQVTGLEFTTNIDLADLFELRRVALPLTINYTYTNATFQNSFDSNFGPWGTVENGDQLPFIPEHQFNAGITMNVDDLSVNLNTVYSPQMRTVAGSGAIEDAFSTDEYFLVDASSSYSLTSNIEIFANIRNLLNETYVVSDRPAGVRPGLPRTVIGGLRFSL